MPLFERPSGLIFWPDIDVYFKADLARAEKLIASLAGAGSDWVKGALLGDPALALEDEASRVTYYVDGRGEVTEPYSDVLARHILPPEIAREVYAMAREAGLRIALSLYRIEDVSFAIELGAEALKIPSSNIVHGPLIRECAGSGLPLVIDTGRSTLAEIAHAIELARDSGALDICVQHSPAAPPAPLTEHRLRFLLTLHESFGVPVGLSDHHAGDEMLYAAVAMGAVLVEKGVCLDDSAPDIDLAHALPVSELGPVLTRCRNIAAALGSRSAPLASEKRNEPARMGLVARRDVRAGERVSLETVDFAWPALGIPVECFDIVAGWCFASDVAARAIIDWTHVRRVAT
jgi:sialic acid synthase SpsE